MRAERLYKVAEYYGSLENRNKAGDSMADYADYWDDLVQLCGDHIAEEDNIRTALVMYGELAYQAGAHAMEFRDAGVSRQAVLYELKRVEKIVTEEIMRKLLSSVTYKKAKMTMGRNISHPHLKSRSRSGVVCLMSFSISMKKLRQRPLKTGNL